LSGILSLAADRARRAVVGNRTETRPDHDDPGLRSRTYAVPFDRVWRGALEIVASRMGWRLLHEDDLEGVIRVAAKTPVLRFTDDVEIRIGLDADAQTRVDVTSASRVGRIDLGTNARRVRRFLKHLDRAVE